MNGMIFRRSRWGHRHCDATRTIGWGRSLWRDGWSHEIRDGDWMPPVETTSQGGGLVLYDMTSSYFKGEKNEWAEYGCICLTTIKATVGDN